MFLLIEFVGNKNKNEIEWIVKRWDGYEMDECRWGPWIVKGWMMSLS